MTPNNSPKITLFGISTVASTKCLRSKPSCDTQSSSNQHKNQQQTTQVTINNNQTIKHTNKPFFF